ncbi:MAG TPA: hypothetical protein VK812_11015 [Candidatus Binatus sp.]|nr:hypothetical protein [Candidatus Binatus sp.]
MKRKLIVAMLAVTASLLLASTAFAQTSTQCTGGANLRFVGIGSSAQTNALAYAATILETNTHGAYGLISFKTSTINDKSAGKTDSGLTTWIVWDPSTVANNVCDAYVYFQTDSGVGVKDFFRYEKFTVGTAHYTSVASAYATLPALPIAAGNVIPGLPDNSTDPNGVPSTIQIALNTTPETQVASNPKPASYCGNLSTVKTTEYWCYFNAGATDVRPEDALYATTRALTSYNGIVPPATHGGTLTGEGYATSSPGCTPTSAAIGCGINDSFNNMSTGGTANSALFNVVKFALSGTDPLGTGTLPAYTTLSVGASPMVVIAGNEDTANLGSVSSVTSTYVYNDINRQILAQVFSGYAGCVADLQATSAGNLSSGVPLQVIEREPLSGSYNTFEWTAVRTQQGGPLLSTAAPNANADNGQEQFNDPNVFDGIFGSSSASCALTANNVPQGNCFDPLFLSAQGGGTNIKVGSQCTGNTGGVAPGIPVRLRAIGTGEEVKAVIGKGNSVPNIGNATVFNPIGYAFWSFGNLNPLCSAVTGVSCTGSWLGHYLTVDGIDPLFATEGGQYDPTPNPSGAFNPPVCDFKPGTTCPTIPFTHIKDGKYPLWSLLRTVTFAPVPAKVATPAGVLDLITTEETESATNGLFDYLPFLKNITGTSPNYKGDLNLFVYRSHYKQTGTTTEANGHKGCLGVFTGVNIQGGKSTASTCLVDFGNDVGGSVLTVQSDVDFVADFATEEYGLRQ